jgi:hypothetical protein
MRVLTGALNFTKSDERPTIVFKPAFKKPPTVFVALQQIDAEEKANIRIDVQVDTASVTADHAIVSFRTWGNTVIHVARAGWLAIGD